jgi:hypothetical protein
MIRAVVSKHSDEIFQRYLMPCLEKYKIKAAIVIDDDDKNESIFTKYNNGIDTHIKDGLTKDDVVAFIHEDVIILDPNFSAKLEMVFSEKKDVGIVGVVGSSELQPDCAWWRSAPDKLRGHIIQQYGDDRNHLIKGHVGYFDDMVALDGLFFAIRGSILLDGFRFDGDTFDGFDFYDIDTCLTIIEKGYKAAVIDTLVEHKSIGDIINKLGWQENAAKLSSKWKLKGYSFPITAESIDTVKYNKTI